MKNKYKKINGLGIALIIILAGVMVWHTFDKMPESPVHLKILEGLLRFGASFLGSGFIYIALLLLMHAANFFCKDIYNNWEEEEDHMKLFTKLNDEFFLICFAASYVLVFIYV